jgi:RNA-directed DNA polymerase
MSSEIVRAIQAEAKKLVTRHQQYLTDLALHLLRNSRRSGVIRQKQVLTPPYWTLDRGFDPYYVRRAASGIGYALERGVRSKTYEPRPAVAYEIPKAGGGTRTVSVFQVADNALSRLVFRRLREKNAPRFSARW